MLLALNIKVYLSSKPVTRLKYPVKQDLSIYLTIKTNHSKVHHWWSREFHHSEDLFVTTSVFTLNNSVQINHPLIWMPSLKTQLL